MNTLKLMVNNSHLYQRIEVTKSTVIDKGFKIPHQPHNFIPILRRRIYHYPVVSFKHCTRHRSEPRLIVFQLLLNLFNNITRKHVFFPNQFKTSQYSCTIIQNLLSCRICKRSHFQIRLIQIILRGHDILDG